MALDIILYLLYVCFFILKILREVTYISKIDPKQLSMFLRCFFLQFSFEKSSSCECGKHNRKYIMFCSFPSESYCRWASSILSVSAVCSFSMTTSLAVAMMAHLSLGPWANGPFNLWVSCEPCYILIAQYWHDEDPSCVAYTAVYDHPVLD